MILTPSIYSWFQLNSISKNFKVYEKIYKKRFSKTKIEKLQWIDIGHGYKSLSFQVDNEFYSVFAEKQFTLPDKITFLTKEESSKKLLFSFYSAPDVPVTLCDNKKVKIRRLIIHDVFMILFFGIVAYIYFIRMKNGE